MFKSRLFENSVPYYKIIKIGKYRFLLVAGELIELVVNHDTSILVVKVINIRHEVLILLHLQEVIIDHQLIIVDRTSLWGDHLTLDA